MRCTLLLLLLCAGMYAQVSHYSFTESSGTYIPVAGTNSTAVGNNGSQDDIPIGFVFNYSNVDYTTFSISTSGFIRLGQPVNTISTANKKNSLRGNTSQLPVIAPFWDDNNKGEGTIRYVLTGAAPYRVLHVGWNDIQINSGSVTNNNTSASFKLALYETTNKIEFVYGNFTENENVLISASVGISDEISCMSVTPGTPSQASSTSVNNTISETTALEGKKFTFTPYSATCTGIPVVSTVTPNEIYTCVGENPLRIVAKITTVGVAGIRYQWQESSDLISWTNLTGIPTCTSRALIPPPFEGETVYYRLKVTCTASGNESYSEIAEINAAAVPITQVSNVTYSQLNYSTARISWRNGSGYRRLVILSDIPEIIDPESGFGVPENVVNSVYAGSGQQIVYDGTSRRADITGLDCNTTYYVKVYEFQRCGADGAFDYYYNTSPSTNTKSFSTGSNDNESELPLVNNFSLFRSTNLYAAYPGWYESSVVTVAGEEPAAQNPLGIVSNWRRSDSLSVSTIATRVGSATTNAWFITPKVFLSDDAVMKFKVALTDYNSSNSDPLGIAGTDDKLNVLISTDDCGAVWHPLFTFSSDNLELDYLTNTLSNFEMDLSDYTGQTVQIAFQATDGPIDDLPIYDFHITDFLIELTDPPLAVEEPVFQSLSYYPNPVINTLTIKNEEAITTIHFYNLIGQELFTKAANTDVVTLDLSDMAAGIYIVKVIAKDKEQNFKIIKK
ncbi:T9SS type A sorting domain-containing protein [Flavobacterium salilacus subsp. salilacus]|uniref:T9SS-dependent choice-of-anchor J family protein n=1 Tax=Flavobacterium TaxID=237 RepID=UPI001074E31E|nr:MULTISPECIES: T9SS type A sorting domain-containing protein [Flavobacterium]KAF2517558.1 T9SS type A sorting domain-containing protein [Flavobacterium salilacus subsp. salilacus]MBE1615707.1 T9SS type A sorting domain-containing protein [Flavobacterium sp. SaA2.13]